MTKLPPFTHSVPLRLSLHWWPVRFRILFKINYWPTKPRVKTSLFIFTPCLPHHSHSVHWDQTTIIVCQFLGSRPTEVQELFTLWNNLPLSVYSAISFATFKKHLKTHLLDLAFHPLTPACPITRWCYGTVSSICYWTLIRLSRHWAWLCWGYWRYRNLIDWCISSVVTIIQCRIISYVFVLGANLHIVCLSVAFPILRALLPLSNEQVNFIFSDIILSYGDISGWCWEIIALFAA